MYSRFRAVVSAALLPVAVWLMLIGLLTLGASLLAGVISATGVRVPGSIAPIGVANYRPWPFSPAAGASVVAGIPPARASGTAPALATPVPTHQPAASATAPTVAAPRPTVTSQLADAVALAVSPTAGGAAATATFSGDTRLTPGGAQVRDVHLTNIGSLACTYTLSVSGGAGILWTNPVKGLHITVAHDGQAVYQGPLAVASLPLNLTLAPGKSADFRLTVWLPESADNTFQDKTTTVSFLWTATGTG